MNRALASALVALACLLPAALPAQQTVAIDPRLAAVLNRAQAIDNHAHPVLAPPAREHDREFDALPVDNMEPQSDPVAWRPDFPELKLAWKALWSFDASELPLTPQQMQQLDAARETVRRRQGSGYDEWVLDRAHIATMLANRVAMGTGIQPPRFRWVPYADALLFPLDNSGMASVSPDRKLFFADEDILRARYLKESGLSAPPPTLSEYLSKVVMPTLERQHAAGAVAEKFEVAYLRGFDFSKPSVAEAERVYGKWLGHGPPDPADYKLLQDFLFRSIARESGRLGMAVHLHTMAGAGSYFGIAGDNPLLLEPVLNDPELRKTNFVLLHGGWPYVREIGALLTKPNVYTDISAQSIVFPPHTQAQWLREWLEYVPEKVLFGTDGYPYSPQMGWEESAWIASHNAREALGIALTGMVRDGEISEARAEQIARDVLRGNAERLYKLQPPSSQPPM